MSSAFETLHDIVKQQTAEFKINFMEFTKISLVKEYKLLPKKIESFNSMLSDVYAKENDISKSYTDEHGRIISMRLFNEAAPTRRSLWKQRDKLCNAINKCKRIINAGEDNFVRDGLIKAETMFDEKVLGLAYRLSQKSFSPDDLKFSNISSDPKLFDVYITSGNKRVHSRSVLAAENSEHMTAHFRFIITTA